MLRKSMLGFTPDLGVKGSVQFIERAQFAAMLELQRYDRTSKGHDELSAGKKTLPAKLRTVLFLVDGNKDVQDIQRQVLLVGAPPDSLSQLATAGYIAPVTEFNAPITAATGSVEDQLSRFRVAK